MDAPGGAEIGQGGEVGALRWDFVIGHLFSLLIGFLMASRHDAIENGTGTCRDRLFRISRLRNFICTFQTASTSEHGWMSSLERRAPAQLVLDADERIIPPWVAWRAIRLRLRCRRRSPPSRRWSLPGQVL